MIDEEGLYYNDNDFTIKKIKKNHDIQVSFLKYFGCVQAIKSYLKSLQITLDVNQIVPSPDRWQRYTLKWKEVNLIMTYQLKMEKVQTVVISGKSNQEEK